MLRLSLPITVYCCAMAALLGACMGSFLNCLTWRMLHGESVLRGRSHCDVCGHVLGVRDLVPVLSYVCSGGKCRYCGAKLSARHVWGELAGGAMFVSALLKYDISLQVLEAWLLACVLLACAFADLEGYIIPDRFLLFGAGVFIVFLAWEPEPLQRLIQGALGGLAVPGALLAVVLMMAYRPYPHPPENTGTSQKDRLPLCLRKKAAASLSCERLRSFRHYSFASLPFGRYAEYIHISNGSVSVS